METDIQRIGVGNNKFPSIRETILAPENFDFSFDSEEISFDTTTETFDEEL